jgi:hypothetical protein
MTLRVVLYAEGGRELASSSHSMPAVGGVVPAEHVGAAHILASRSLHRARSIPEAAIRFEMGLRKASGGSIPRGSDLCDRKTLRKLLSWPRADQIPDLVIVLVDADGDRSRKQSLIENVRGLTVPRVIAVATQEFDAWLVADGKAVAAVCGAPFDLPGNIEALERAMARETLDRALQTGSPSADELRGRRTSIARLCDLTTVERRCSGYREFLADLRTGSSEGR